MARAPESSEPSLRLDSGVVRSVRHPFMAKKSVSPKVANGLSTSKDVAAFRAASSRVASKALSSPKAAEKFLKRLGEVKTTFGGAKK